MSFHHQTKLRLRVSSALLIWIYVVFHLALIGVSSCSSSSSTSTSASTASSRDLRTSEIPTAAPSPSSSSPSLSEQEPEKQRAVVVRRELCERLAYVLSGRRQSDIKRWIKAQPGGQATVISMHGVNSNEHSINFDQTSPTSPSVVLRKDDPFPPNRYSLDLVFDNITSTGGLLVSESSKDPLHLVQYTKPTVLQLAWRAIQLGFHFSPVLSTVGLAFVSQTFRSKVWYAWLARCMGNGGAAWCKWGQWSSTRNDVFPEALCEQLASLHNDAPAHAWTFSEQTLEKSLGLQAGTLPQVFGEFDQVPLASGSIAQVYKAVLNGQLVAIKIRHPRVAELIDMDFRLMTAAARLFDYLPGFKWLHIRESVEQFSHTMAAQSDLHVEAHHLEILNHNFRHWPHVRFPQPFFASSAVIMETFEPGRIVTGVIDMYDRLAETIRLESKIAHVKESTGDDSVDDSDEDRQQKGGGSVDRIAVIEDKIKGHELIPIGIAKFLVTTGLGVYLKMLLVDNLMHADLHPGNIMISFHRHSPRNKSENKQLSESLVMIPHHDPYVSSKHLHRLLGICLVDAGMVAQLTDEESSTFIGLLSSLGEGDGASAAEFALAFSLENNMDEKERASFTQDMVELFAERCQGYGTGVDVGHVLRGVLGLVRKHRVRIDANFATLVVNCLCIESLGRSLCPSYNVLDAARPLLQGYRSLCYDKQGQAKPEAFRKSGLVKLCLSFMYIRKNLFDLRFFKQEEKQIKERTRAQRLLLEMPS